MTDNKIIKEYTRFKKLFKISDEELKNDIDLHTKLLKFSRLSLNCINNLNISALKLFSKCDYSYIIEYCTQFKNRNNELRIDENNIVKYHKVLYNKIKKFCKVNKTWDKYQEHIDDKNNHFRCICGKKHIIHLYPILYKDKLYVIGSDCIFSIDLMLRSKYLDNKQANDMKKTISIHKDYLKNKDKKYCCLGCNKKYNSKKNIKYCIDCSNDIKTMFKKKYKNFRVLFGKHKNFKFSELSSIDLYNYLDTNFCKNNKKYSIDFYKLKNYNLGICNSK